MSSLFSNSKLIVMIMRRRVRQLDVDVVEGDQVVEGAVGKTKITIRQASVIVRARAD